MRTYSAELLAAVAFVACLSRCSTSGSKTSRSDVPSSDHPNGHEDDTSDDIAQRNDEEESEARMPVPSGEILAELEKLQAIKRPDSSGTLSQGLDLSLRLGRENSELSERVAKTLSQKPDHPRLLDLSLRLGSEQAPVVDPRLAGTKRIIEQLQAHTNPECVKAESWAHLKEGVTNADDRIQHTWMDELVKMYGTSDGGRTEFASALRKAKANGLSADEAKLVEGVMVDSWVRGGVTTKKAFELLGLYGVVEREGLTDDNLVLFKKFIHCRNGYYHGDSARLDSSLVYVFRRDFEKGLRIIARSPKVPELATTILNGLIRYKMFPKNQWERKPYHRANRVVNHLLEAELSESMIQLMLSNPTWDKIRVKHKESWTELTTLLLKTLKSGWMDAVEEAVNKKKSSNKPRTKRPKRKEDSALRIGPAPARKKRASKSQKITGLPIQR